MSISQLEVPGGRIAYEVREPVERAGASGGAPLVVCSPVMGDVRGVYEPLAEALCEAGFRVVTADLRGHGDSSADFPECGDEATAADIIALIESHGHGPAVVVGPRCRGRPQ